MASSRISIRHTAGGVTIRATGAAAQALADAITHGAERVRSESQQLPAVFDLVVEVMWNGDCMLARALPTPKGDEQRAGLKDVTFATHSTEPDAVVELLRAASPSLRVSKWVSCYYADRGRRLEYTIKAEAL